MAGFRADGGRRTPRRRWIAGVVGALSAGIVVPMAEPAQVAQAELHGPIPYNEAVGEIYEFVDDDALSILVRSDLRGGTACVVEASVEDPADGSCDTPAWGTPNDIIGIGTVITLLQAPSLVPGDWRILVQNSVGEPTEVSEIFTVTACQTCSREAALSVVNAWK